MSTRRRPAKLVVLDRDGTINRDSPDYIRTADEWRPLPGALDAIALLVRHGWTVVVATNQSGLGRGLFALEALHEMHDKMQHLLAERGARVDAIFFCPHTPDDNCECRKPKPGLLHQVAERYRIDLANVPVVGDSERDLQAAEAAGAIPILVRTGYGRQVHKEWLARRGVAVYDDLAAVAEDLIAADEN